MRHRQLNRTRSLALRLALTALALPLSYRSRSARVLVLFSPAAPSMIPRCASGVCDFLSVERAQCSAPREERVATVIVSGHSSVPTYLGLSSDEVANRIACRHPELIVLDTCFGASEPLLSALARRLPDAVVVGPTFRVADRGFEYDSAFFLAGSATERAASVRARSGLPLTVLSLRSPAIAAARVAARSLQGAELRRALVRVAPPLAVVRGATPNASIVVAVQSP